MAPAGLQSGDDEISRGIEELEKQLLHLQQMEEQEEIGGRLDAMLGIDARSTVSAVHGGRNGPSSSAPLDPILAKAEAERERHRMAREKIEAERELQIQREAQWQKELEQRKRGIDDERKREEQLRRDRERERQEWERREQDRENDKQRLHWEVMEKERDRQRQLEWEEEQEHERAREEAYRKEIEWERERRRLLTEAMQREQALAERRLQEILQGEDINGLSSLDAGRLVDGMAARVFEEEKERLRMKDQLRADTLARERTQLRELEERWEQQVSVGRSREKTAREQREKSRVGEVLQTTSTHKLKQHLWTEERKAEVPPYLIVCLLRTMDEQLEEHALVGECVGILCRILHGPGLERKQRVCETILQSAYGVRPIARAFNRYHDDPVLVGQLLRILKLASAVSPAFSVQHGLMPFAPGAPGVTSGGDFVAASTREVRRAVQTVHTALASPMVSVVSVIHALEALKVHLQLLLGPLGSRDSTFAEEESISGLLVTVLERFSHEQYLCVLVLEIALLILGRGAATKLTYAIFGNLSVPPTRTQSRSRAHAHQLLGARSAGKTFLTSLVGAVRGTRQGRTAALFVDFVIALWAMERRSVERDMLNAGVLPTLVLVAERFPQLRTHIYTEWEKSGIGNADVADLIEQIGANCTGFTLELRALLFDLSVRFHVNSQRSRSRPNSAALEPSRPGTSVSRVGPNRPASAGLNGRPPSAMSRPSSAAMAHRATVDSAIAFLSESRGVTTLQHVFNTIAETREAVLHVVWAITQAGEAIQYTERFAEELSDSGLLTALLEFGSTQLARHRIDQIIDIVAFCVEHSPEAERSMQRPEHIEELLALYDAMRVTVDVPAVTKQRLKDIFVRIQGSPPQLENLPDIWGVEHIQLPPTEQRATALVNTMLRIQNDRGAFSGPWYRHKGTTTAVRVLQSYQTAPVEMLCIELLHGILVEPPLGSEPPSQYEQQQAADEFCESGGLPCLLAVLGRYASDGNFTAQAWRIALFVLLNASPRNVTETLVPEEHQKTLSSLLFKTRTGDTFLRYSCRHRDLLEILHDSVGALKKVEGEVKGGGGSAPLDALEELEASIYTQLVCLGVESTQSAQDNPPTLRPGTSASTLFNLLAPTGGETRDPVEIWQWVNDGGIRILCRALEIAGERMSPNTVRDVLSVINHTLGFVAPARSTSVTAHETASPLPDPAAVQLLARIDVKRNLELIGQILAWPKYQDDALTQELIWRALLNLLRSSETFDEDRLIERLQASAVPQRCIDYYFDNGTADGNNAAEISLALLQVLCSRDEEMEKVVWNLGGMDIAYVAYQLTNNLQVRALSVACMASHALYDDDHRAIIDELGGLQLAKSLFRNISLSCDESWAAMLMVSALSLPTEYFISEVVGEGLLYLFADRLSAYSQIHHTRAAVRCMLQVLRVSLSYRATLKDLKLAAMRHSQLENSKGANNGFAPPSAGTLALQVASNQDRNLLPWLTNEALTCCMEWLLYRVSEVFSTYEAAVDLHTVDSVVQYLNAVLSLDDPSVASRLLHANARKLVAYILSFKGITPRIQQETERVLQTMQQWALRQGFAAFHTQYLQPTPRPTVPLIPTEHPLPQSSPLYEVQRRQHMHTAVGGGGIVGLDGDWDAVDPLPASSLYHRTYAGRSAEETLYLQSVSAEGVLDEALSALLTRKPARPQDVYAELAVFFAGRARHLTPGLAPGSYANATIQQQPQAMYQQQLQSAYQPQPSFQAQNLQSLSLFPAADAPPPQPDF